MRAVDESRAARLGRRALTLPAYALGFLVLVAALPLLLAAALACDAVRSSRFAATRLVLFALAYLGCEVIGIAASGVLWLAALGRPHRLAAAHTALQSWWANALLASGVRAFGLRLEVEGDRCVRPGPILLLVRHTSLADTVLPAVLVGRRHHMRLRWVLKRELLWDPCLDLVGQRLRNVFVRRGSGEGAREAAAVRELARGLDRDEGVVLYPEGTRFTPAKRERIRAALAGRDPERARRTAGLRAVLPPHSGGALALLEGAPRADVVLVAHVGLEAAAHVADLWRGGLTGRTVRVRLTRFARDAIPAEAEARRRWLDERWLELDEWVCAELADRAGGAAHAGRDRTGAPR